MSHISLIYQKFMAKLTFLCRAFLWPKFDRQSTDTRVDHRVTSADPDHPASAWTHDRSYLKWYLHLEREQNTTIRVRKTRVKHQYFVHLRCVAFCFISSWYCTVDVHKITYIYAPVYYIVHTGKILQRKLTSHFDVESMNLNSALRNQEKNINSVI